MVFRMRRVVSVLLPAPYAIIPLKYLLLVTRNEHFHIKL